MSLTQGRSAWSAITALRESRVISPAGSMTVASSGNVSKDGK